MHNWLRMANGRQEPTVFDAIANSIPGRARRNVLIRRKINPKLGEGGKEGG